MSLPRIYLAHSIATKGEFEDSKRVANQLRKLGYSVYVASENEGINDKTNNPTPIDIYNGDIEEIKKCDIFVVNLSGGLQDGTISEIGFVAGINEYTYEEYEDKVPIIAYTTNARLQHPQFYQNISSASVNHLVLGMIAKWGHFIGSEENLYGFLKDYEYFKILGDILSE